MDIAELLARLLNVENQSDQQALFETSSSLLTQDTLQGWKQSAHEYAYAGDARRALSTANIILDVGEWRDDDSIRALGNWTCGNVYTIIGEANDAQPYYQAAERHYRVQKDDLNLARMRVGIVYQLYQAQKYKEACQLAEETEPVLAASHTQDDQKRLASIANNWAISLDHLGDYEKALALYERKIALWKQWPDNPRTPLEIARTQVNIGILKKRVNLWAEAEISLDAGQQALRGSSTDQYRKDLVNARIHLADLLGRRGAPPDVVLDAFDQAHAVRASLPGSDEDILDLLHLDLLEFEWRLRAGYVPTDSLNRLTALRAQATAAGQARETMRTGLLLANYHALQGNIPEAIASCTDVRESAHTSDDWEMLYRAWYTLGWIHVQRKDTLTALEAFQSAVAMIESVGQQVASGDLRSGFLEDKLIVYQDLIGLYLDKQDSASAFHWAERARARELVEMLAEADISWSAHPEIEPLLEQLAQIRQQLATAIDDQRRQHLETRVTDLVRRIATFEPRAREWLTGKTAALSDLRAALPAGALLLVYTVVHDDLWVLPLTCNGICSPCLLGTVPDAEILMRDLGWLRNLASYQPAFIKRRAEPLITSARRSLVNWYDQLVAPLSSLLAQHQQLIIAPDGPLFRLPFHAFYNSATGRYLLETHHVSYTPSATAWLLANQRQPCGQGGLALAYDGDYLNHTTTEVQAILNAHPDFTAYVGSDATVERLLRGDLTSKAALIHLAAHAVFRGDKPLFSRVELTDGHVETLDVLRLRLNAALVVLSACETGLGLLRGGEYLGLARAFLIAGAQSVLASHWAVDDAATAELVSDFYRHLATGEQPAQALRSAQLAALSSAIPHHRHPYYWASFFLLGAEG
ncbi:MAG: CHAT domain-containing protein [Chloroflexi bacterium]|nr:CHAT domain-containing protein [Chloroflexota bacterium]